MPITSYQRKLFLAALGIAALIIVRLWIAADATDNWRGFFYSTFHVFLVAGGTVFFLWEEK